MCGIAGAFQQPDGKTAVSTMTDRIGHRGPDASGIIELVSPESAVVLGHRRLSIIDLSSAADQPLAKDGLTLTYNGEIYNYREIRRELEAGGVRFTTRSDTEVVLEAWRRWGAASLRRLRGMFAFAIHDEQTGSLTLARDPFGIKPLYVMPRGEGILFASELKALLAAVGSELVIEPAAMVASALYYWVPQEYVPVRGVHKLPPGTWTEYHRDGYGDVRNLLGRRCGGCACGPRAGGRPARGARLVGGGPPRRRRPCCVASSAAGSTRASSPHSPIVATPRSRPTPSRSARRTSRLEAMPDDARYARQMAAHLGIPLHEIEISPDVVELLPRMVDVLDEPIGDPAAINTLLMCEAARQAGVKVLLSGMGADELFGGYRKHLAMLMAARYRRVPGPVRSLCRPGGAGTPGRGRRPRICAPSGGPSDSSPSPSCPRRRRSGAATPSTAGTSWRTCSTRRSQCTSTE